MSELDIIWRLGLALVLSSVIGLEREIGQKSAGLRTYTLVGVGAAVFMIVSIYGFHDSLGNSHTALDPSRVAAQIVSGIGFIGGGIIFVRRDTVRGLTTAAGVWVTAGVGMACGGDLPLIAISDLEIKHEHDGDDDGDPRHVTVALEVRGQGSLAELASDLNELEGVVGVYAGTPTSSATEL